MLNYYRSENESLPPYNRENALSLRMLESPYKVNDLPSETDSSSRAIDTNHISPWYRNVAFTAAQDPDYTNLFSQPSINWISAQITLRLRGVHPEGKDIVVPDYTILSVADSWYNGTQLSIEMLQEMTILHIVDIIKNDYQTMEQNDKLSAWVQLYDMTTGMNKWDKGAIKLNEKRGTSYYSWNY
jgi:hypothetical protein